MDAGLVQLDGAAGRVAGPAPGDGVVEPREIRAGDIAPSPRSPTDLGPCQRLATRFQARRALRRQPPLEAPRDVVDPPGQQADLLGAHLRKRNAVDPHAGRQIGQPARVRVSQLGWMQRDDIEAPPSLRGVARELLPAQRPDRGVRREMVRDQEEPGLGVRRAGHAGWRWRRAPRQVAEPRGHHTHAAAVRHQQHREVPPAASR